MLGGSSVRQLGGAADRHIGDAHTDRLLHDLLHIHRKECAAGVCVCFQKKISIRDQTRFANICPHEAFKKILIGVFEKK